VDCRNGGEKREGEKEDREDKGDKGEVFVIHLGLLQ